MWRAPTRRRRCPIWRPRACKVGAKTPDFLADRQAESGLSDGRALTNRFRRARLGVPSSNLGAPTISLAPLRQYLEVFMQQSSGRNLRAAVFLSRWLIAPFLFGMACCLILIIYRFFADLL